MKRSKYGAIKTTVDGITFDSKKEADFYGRLKVLQKGGLIKTIELQPQFKWKMICFHPDDLTAPIYNKNYKYIADFRVTWSDGKVQIIDVKGFLTQTYKQKKKIVEKIYGITITEK